MERAEPSNDIARRRDETVARAAIVTASEAKTVREISVAAFATAVDNAAPARAKLLFPWRSLRFPSASAPTETSASKHRVAAEGRIVETPADVRSTEASSQLDRFVVDPAESETIASVGDVSTTPGVVPDAAEAAVRAATSDPIVVPAPTRYAERIVPITRLPLRRHPSDIAWWAAAGEVGTEPPTRAERHALLARAVDGTVALHPSTVERAYFEEDRDGRLLALRALVARDPADHRAAFVDALHVGTDNERELAVDGLAAGGAMDALPVAFRDRVEAIAARAVLAYVGAGDRETFRAALAPHVDDARIVALLALLAGVIE